MATDFKSISFNRPIDPQNFEQLMEEYITLCTDLSRKIMQGIALALGGSIDEFDVDRAGDPIWALCIIGYPGLLALVNQDDDITALQSFSNGLYESTLQRVINNSPKYRVCLAYIYEGPWIFAYRGLVELRSS